VLRRRFDDVANVVVGVAAEAGCVVEIGALLQQRRQFGRFPCNLLIDVGEIAARGPRLLHLLRIPERSRTQHQAEKNLERRRMRMEFVVQFFVGIAQLNSTPQRSICNGVFAGQDVVFAVVALPLQKKVFNCQFCFLDAIFDVK